MDLIFMDLAFMDLAFLDLAFLDLAFPYRSQPSGAGHFISYRQIFFSMVPRWRRGKRHKTRCCHADH